MVSDDRPDRDTGHGRPAADSATLLRPDVVAAYASNPRNEPVAATSSPEVWRARWLPTVVAALLTGVLVAGGTTIRVPVEAPAIVTGVAPGRLTVLMHGDVPSAGRPVTFSVPATAAAPRYTGVADVVADGVVELRTGAVDAIGVGTPLTLELGEESLLFALATS